MAKRRSEADHDDSGLGLAPDERVNACLPVTAAATEKNRGGKVAANKTRGAGALPPL